MNAVAVADGVRPAAERLGAGRGRMMGRDRAALVQHELVIDGVPATVVIERPESERSAWRCRVRIARGIGRLEQSQVVGTSASAVLEQALDLVAARVGLSVAEVLGGASVGAELARPQLGEQRVRTAARRG
ncbi:hypothetical protein BJY24_006905 [Nocardia transvalensis]|uniref:Uncharacterized protein n=1 Tax=Nocardia transvalensis TaxID=37333 RepID=A0A7W9PM37_9NOCA|nr:hypothetical protein [Nocardia transvalensis]MBB5917993.1 hypothetical protein [Nocardia transvalensis]